MEGWCCDFAQKKMQITDMSEKKATTTTKKNY